MHDAHAPLLLFATRDPASSLHILNDDVVWLITKMTVHDRRIPPSPVGVAVCGNSALRDLIVSSFLALPIVITASCEQSFSLSHVDTHHIEYTRQVTVRQRRVEMAKRERNDMRVARRRCDK
jgi:hypothetical protein